MTNCTAGQRLWSPQISQSLQTAQSLWISDFEDFTKLVKFTELSERIERRLNSQKSSNSQREMNSWKRVTAPQLTPIYKWSMKSMVWNISIGQLGLAACLYPSFCSPAH